MIEHLFEGRRFSFGSRPVITLFGDPRDFRNLLRAMDASTLKRRAFRMGLLILSHGHLLSRVGRRLNPSQREEITNVASGLLDLAANRRLPVRSLSVNWPTGDRAHRRYVLATDYEGDFCFFAKVSERPDLDTLAFEREHDVLTRLTEHPLSDWRTPRSYICARAGQRLTLVQEPLPAKSTCMSMRAIRQMLPVKSNTYRMRVTQTTWFKTSVAQPMSSTFTECISSLADATILVGLVNGDIRPSNAIRSRQDRWLFDWEFGAWDAPRDADVLVAILNALASKKTNLSPRVLHHLVLKEAALAGIRLSDVIVGLLYLATIGHSAARGLIQLPWTPPVLDPTRRTGASRMNKENNPTYRNEFDDAQKAEHYDLDQYGEHSWSAIMWELEQLFLTKLLTDASFVPQRDRYLDFACGTGRVTHLISSRFVSATGVDISAAMLDRARLKVPGAVFREGDVLTMPDMAGDDFDLITSFRFFLNADPGDRVATLTWMRDRLRDSSSRIIVNNHSNLWTHKALPYAYRIIKQRGRLTTGNVLSHRAMSDLVHRAGLRITSIYGMGHLGGHALRALPFGAMQRLQKTLAGVPVLQKLGENQIYVLSAS